MSKKKRMKSRMTRAERQKLMRKRRRKRIALLVTEVLILAALCVTAYGIFKLDKLDFNILNDKNLEAYKDTGPYTNIALFGLDSRNDELDGGVQSDCIMIASINNDTSDVTLTPSTGIPCFSRKTEHMRRPTRRITGAARKRRSVF